MVARPVPEEEEQQDSQQQQQDSQQQDSQQQHLCLEAAYDSEPVRQELEARSYEPHISSADKKKRIERKEARQHPDGRARRWVV